MRSIRVVFIKSARSNGGAVCPWVSSCAMKCRTQPRTQGCVKVDRSTLGPAGARPAGRIDGCGSEPFAHFDTRSVPTQGVHSMDFDAALPGRAFYCPGIQTGV
jgi:hypothetical protein